jgi:hypothetical protein
VVLGSKVVFRRTGMPRPGRSGTLGIVPVLGILGALGLVPALGVVPVLGLIPALELIRALGLVPAVGEAADDVAWHVGQMPQ